MRTSIAFLLLEGVLSTVHGTVLQQLWVHDTGGSRISGAPAVAGDGTVYIAAGVSVLAVTNNGAVASNKWVFASPAQIAPGAPVVGLDGTVYVAAGDLYALSPAGGVKWSYPLGGGNASPAVGADGTIYVAGYADLHAVTADGQRRWACRIGSGTGFGSPAVAPDGSIYITTPHDLVSGVRTDGTKEWELSLGYPAESPAITGSGNIILNTGNGGGVYAFASGGSNLWSWPDPNGIPVGPSSSVALGRNGVIYVENDAYYGISGYGFRLYAISPSGQTEWALSTNLQGNGTSILGAPAVDASGTIYCAAYDKLFAVSSNGQVQAVFDSGGDYSYCSPTIAQDGTIYAAFGSKLYALAGTNALSDSPWPMYRQNPRHTGKVEKPSLQRPKKRADANFEFEVFAQLSNTFSIEASTNLTDWNSLTSFVATTVPMDIADLDATNHPGRFYRAADISPPGAKRARR